MKNSDLPDILAEHIEGMADASLGYFENLMLLYPGNATFQILTINAISQAFAILVANMYLMDDSELEKDLEDMGQTFGNNVRNYIKFLKHE